MNPSSTPNLNPERDDKYYAKSSADSERGLTAKVISLTNEEIDRIFNERFVNAANDSTYSPEAAKEFKDKSQGITGQMAA